MIEDVLGVIAVGAAPAALAAVSAKLAARDRLAELRPLREMAIYTEDGESRRVGSSAHSWRDPSGDG